MNLALLFIGAYVLGSIPFAVIIGKMNNVDILATGSGNPGMTNVGRILGPKWGAICFALDILKGLIPTLVARFFVVKSVHGCDPEFIWFSVGFVAILGHCTSIFLKFKGGKGISTAAGAIAAASPFVFLVCVLVFLVFLATFRFVSLASVMAVGSSIVSNLIFPTESRQLLPVYLALTLFVIYRHRKNIDRIRNQKEPKVKLPWDK